MSALFAEDAIWETSAGTLGFRHEGRPVIHAWLTSNPGHVEVVFYLASEPTVELLSLDRARAQTSITELLRFQDSGEIKQLFGVYTDELVKQAGEWRFAHRRFTLRHMTTMKQPDRR